MAKDKAKDKAAHLVIEQVPVVDIAVPVPIVKPVGPHRAPGESDKDYHARQEEDWRKPRN